MSVTEKIPHTYEFTGRELADALNLKGVVISISANSYQYEEKDSGKCKTAYKITVNTMERSPDDEKTTKRSKK